MYEYMYKDKPRNLEDVRVIFGSSFKLNKSAF